MTTQANAVAAEKPFHYFASTAFHWVIGETRQEVIAQLAKMAGTDTIKRSQKDGGLYCWTCRVLAPRSARYDIAWFAPQGVDIEDAQAFNIQNTKGFVTTIEPKAKQEVAQ